MNSDPAGAAAASTGGGGRAFGFGPRSALLGAVAVVVLAGAGIAAAVELSSGPKAAPGATYAYHTGKLPAWIPSTKAPANPGPVTASLVRPVSTLVEGDTVHAIFTHGMAMVVVSGPTEPASVERAIQDGRSKSGQQSPGTFYVNYSNVQGVVPVAASGFNVITPAGRLHAAKVSVRGGGPIPKQLHQGQRLTLMLHFTLIPAGEGAIAWTPSPNRLIAGWDFDFELT